jgi:hypothetical protein
MISRDACTGKAREKQDQRVMIGKDGGRYDAVFRLDKTNFDGGICGQRRKIEHRFTLVADVKAECDPEPTHLNTSDLRLSHQRGTFTTEPIGLSVRSAFGFSVQRRQYCSILRSIGIPSVPAKTGLQYIELAVVCQQSQAAPPLPLFVLSFKKGQPPNEPAS